VVSKVFHLLLTGSCLHIILNPEFGGSIILENVGGLHSAKSQKTVLFKRNNPVLSISCLWVSSSEVEYLYILKDLFEGN
jgi:hypothetical protein